MTTTHHSPLTTHPPDVFSTAKPKGKTRKKDGTALTLEGQALADALGAYQRAKAAEKAAADQKATAWKELAPAIRAEYVSTWCELGQRPKTPVRVTAGEHSSTYCVEDRSATEGVALTDTFLNRLADVVGDEAVLRTVDEAALTYEFDAAVLAEPGVREKVAAAIKLSLLTEEQKGKLIVYRRRLGKPALETLAPLCDDEERLLELLDVLGGSVRTYLKG